MSAYPVQPVSAWLYLVASVSMIPLLLAIFPELRRKRALVHVLGAVLLAVILGSVAHATGTDPVPTFYVNDPCAEPGGWRYFLNLCWA